VRSQRALRALRVALSPTAVRLRSRSLIATEDAQHGAVALSEALAQDLDGSGVGVSVLHLAMVFMAWHGLGRH